MVQSQALPLHGGKRGEEEKDIQMDRASGGVCLVMGQAGHFWLRLYSLSRDQGGGVRAWSLCRCQQGGDTASTTRRSGLG